MSNVHYFPLLIISLVAGAREFLRRPFTRLTSRLRLFLVGAFLQARPILSRITPLMQPVLPKDPLYHTFFLRTLSHASSLGADTGECFAALQEATRNGLTTHAWAAAWSTQAKRLDEHAARMLVMNPPQTLSARLAYLRASNYHRTAFLPLFGHPLDEGTVMPAYEATRSSFSKATALFEPPLVPLEVPYEDAMLGGYLCKPPSGVVSNDRLHILIGGYDAPMEELYFFTGHHALLRGYSVLRFDGPGQGGTLLESGIAMSHDYDKVLEAVLDVSAQYDTWKHTIVQGLSFGGLLCLKAVASKSVQ